MPAARKGPLVDSGVSTSLYPIFRRQRGMRATSRDSTTWACRADTGGSSHDVRRDQHVRRDQPTTADRCRGVGSRPRLEVRRGRAPSRVARPALRLRAPRKCSRSLRWPLRRIEPRAPAIDGERCCANPRARPRDLRSRLNDSSAQAHAHGCSCRGLATLRQRASISHPSLARGAARATLPMLAAREHGSWHARLTRSRPRSPRGSGSSCRPAILFVLPT